MKSALPVFKSIALAASLSLAFCAPSARADYTAWSNSTTRTAGVGGGGFNFNNGSSLIGVWDNFSDFGDLIFTANFNNTTFDNTASNSGSSISAWGETQTATYGQTFVAGEGTTSLKDFTFFISDFGSGSNTTYQAFVMTWSGGLHTGTSSDQSSSTLLYASDPLAYVGNGSFQAVTSTIEGGLSLTAGNSYLIGLTTLGTNVVPPTGSSHVPDQTSSAMLLALGAGVVVAGRRRFLA